MDFKTTGAIRVTIHDHEQTISLLADRQTAMRLVAGCSSNPQTLDELLLATEVYQQGIAAWLMSELMEFDKAWRRGGAAYLRRAFDADADGAEQPVAFEVVDAQTEKAAAARADGALLVIDLPARHIRLAGAVEIPAEGEVLVHDGRQVTDRTITYILPQTWHIDALR